MLNLGPIASSMDGVSTIINGLTPGMLSNIGVATATTTNANDSIKITGVSGALSSANPGFISMPSATIAGQTTNFSITSDVTILISGATWGMDGSGDLTNAYLRIYAINDNGTLRFGVSFQGGKNTTTGTNCSTTQANIDLPEEILTNSTVSSGGWPCKEIGYFRANFTDSTNVWANSTSVLTMGSTADGLWQPYQVVAGGFSSPPSYTSYRWASHGRTVIVQARINSTGTSNATTYTMRLPLKAAFANVGSVTSVTDNGVAIAGMTYAETTASSQTITLYRTGLSSSAWNAANGKGASFSITYESLFDT